MKKQQWMLIGITAVFLCLIIGIFIGRNLTGSYISINNSDSTETSATTVQGNDGKIDINSANTTQLRLIPGIGETIAQRIIDYRTENGNFTTVEELLNVSGIGEKKLEQMKPYIKVTPN